MDDRFGDYLVATCNSVRRLVRTPAPDLAALGVKIALVVYERVGELIGGERCMATLKADAPAVAVFLVILNLFQEPRRFRDEASGV